MKKHYLDIDSSWGIIFCYDFDVLDAEEMGAIMDSFGMEESEIRYAMRVLFGTNTGMTVSRSDLTMSVIFVGESSSIEQFMDSCAHEIDHVQSAILRHYGIEQGGEDAAWLQGFIMRKIVKVLNADGFLCD